MYLRVRRELMTDDIFRRRRNIRRFEIVLYVRANMYAIKILLRSTKNTTPL